MTHVGEVANVRDVNMHKLTEDQKKELSSPTEQALARIRETTVLAVVRDTLHRYLNDGYQLQIATLNKLLEESGEKGPRIVTSGSISVTFPKVAIESDEDLDAYLEAVRKAYGEVLKDNGKITL